MAILDNSLIIGVVDTRNGVVLVPDTGIVVRLEPGSSSECDHGVGVGGGDLNSLPTVDVFWRQNGFESHLRILTFFFLPAIFFFLLSFGQ